MESKPSRSVDVVVLYAGMGVGHLLPMVELAKLFLSRRFDVTIAVPATPGSAATGSPTIAGIAASNPSVTFHHLPPPPSYADPDPNPLLLMLDVLRLSVPSLVSLLGSLPSVSALVLDIFCAEAVNAAAALHVPAYIYFTSSANTFATSLGLMYHDSTTTASLKDMGKAVLRFPGVPPVRASDMPSTLQDRESRFYKARTKLYACAMESSGVLLNTYEWIEARAVGALREGACFPGRPTPPVYCVGPLVGSGKEEERHACLAWMDSQPARSVVFLCFGSMGSFSAAQLKEIARGLERSGHRFLWVVRSPRQDPTNLLERLPEPDLAALLPEGFMERTADRGMVVKSWAPQAKVLRHAATGAFVTHCGWNSTLEGVASGVPLLCWPLYAEQWLNKVLIVEEMKAGVVIDGYDEELVRAEEVEAKVRLVMESDAGEKLRERLAMAKAKAVEALAEHGPSRVAFNEFLDRLVNSE
ncbi:anthocyanidin 5,3-O-glucosyltransferase-like [Oryza brachyantha]|uniref:Glycosyltransferase n=1 Tax=Oryza brachyantha TaxID=4533 RepID=J3L3U1_ORYBR|nr:anthocyanidin 5,3-O-glucosyltransferase-like [Oryza brachyantha]